jgi:hypothetical protein
MKSDLFEHLLTKMEKSAWLTLKAVCPNFFGNVKANNYRQLVEDLLNIYQTMQCNMLLKIQFFTFPPGRLPSEPVCSEWGTWGKVPPGYFHHGEQKCREVLKEHVSRLLSEPYRKSIYCQLEMNELQKEVLNVIKIEYLFSYFCCVTAWSYFDKALLQLLLDSLCSFQHEKRF